MNSFFEKIYPMMPVGIQNAMCSLHGRNLKRLRYNDLFHKKLEWLNESQFWNAAEIETYKNTAIRNLIFQAYEQVPYYRKIMDERGITPKDIETYNDLVKLPILQKEHIRKNKDLFIARNAEKGDLIHSHTSGTTGKSLQFFHGKEQIALQWAVWWRHRMRFGAKPGDLHANFTGKIVVPPSQKRPPFWRWNRPLNQALIPMHHITRENIPAILRFLDEQPFVFYSGYPSIIHMVALMALQEGIPLHNSPQYIFTGAENILDYQRKDIETFCNAILTDQYGLTEGCGNASQCREMIYHEDFEFSHLECVDPQVDKKTGRIKGKIICTGLANPGFPFIRYDTGDIGIWEKPGVECKCGRHSAILIGIEGRKDDYVITPEGTRIMRFDYIFKDTHTVKEAQVIQRNLGEIIIKIVKRDGYDTSDEHYIRNEVEKWISRKLVVHFEYVNELERESNGKFRAVKSEL